MTSTFRAAAAYLILIAVIRFGTGFLINATTLGGRLGDLGAAGLMLAVTVAIAWLAAMLSTRLFDIPAYVGPRLVMGIAALTLLLVIEARMAMSAGLSLKQHFTAYGRPAGLLDVVGLAAVALIPTLQIATRRKPTV